MSVLQASPDRQSGPGAATIFSLGQARETIENWRLDYNALRPDSAPGDAPRQEFEQLTLNPANHPRSSQRGCTQGGEQVASDNGPQYRATATVLYAHELGLVPITAPAYSPQSNGLAEAFVKTFKRDYVDGTERRDADSVLAQLQHLDRGL